MKTLEEYINESTESFEGVVKTVKKLIGTSSKQYSHSKNSIGFMINKPIKVRAFIDSINRKTSLRPNTRNWGKEHFDGLIYYTFSASIPYGDIILSIAANKDTPDLIFRVEIAATSDRS